MPSAIPTVHDLEKEVAETASFVNDCTNNIEALDAEATRLRARLEMLQVERAFHHSAVRLFSLKNEAAQQRLAEARRVVKPEGF